MPANVNPGFPRTEAVQISAERKLIQLQTLQQGSYALHAAQRHPKPGPIEGLAERDKLAFAAACLKTVDHQEYARQGQIESLSCRRRANPAAPIGFFSRLWDQTLSPMAASA